MLLAYKHVVLNDSSGILALAKQVGYYVAPSGKLYPDNWIITDFIYELEGSLYSRLVLNFMLHAFIYPENMFSFYCLLPITLLKSPEICVLFSCSSVF